ncbi:hypothetical protein GDO81_004573 [Engystomops pustulosus]|uniref:N-terminal Ras-GEF domain-containing protein n=1 Tax=Engystomops pustulosus TaxID=76066 RepID=A0AAV6ZU31_ENGPU|nr:hypothetical protein GDO81_004573 [Engystomops pustulosus]
MAKLKGNLPLLMESMPQTPIFPSMLGSACSGQVQPEMGEQCGDPVFQDGCLVSGSLEALIERLVPTLDYYPDRTYIFTFLLSARVFIHPHEILAKVGQICIKQKQQLEAGTEADKHHMDPSSNFCNYRTALQGATQRSQSANSSREKIVIPVFNLFIKDIFFLHKIHANRLPNGHINFKKFMEISRQIHDFLTWKQVECPFEKDKKIHTYLLTSPIYTEEALFVASFENEGPDNHMEKDSWKTLRSTLLNRA